MSTQRKSRSRPAFSLKIDTSHFSAQIATSGKLVPWQLILVVCLAILLYWMPHLAECLKLALSLLSS